MSFVDRNQAQVIDFYDEELKFNPESISAIGGEIMKCSQLRVIVHKKYEIQDGRDC
jgi:hypothetical protein